MEELKPYWVLSPEYCVGVLALDENHAKILGIAAMRKSKDCRYISDDPSENPFAILEALPALCPHGTWEFTETFEDGRVNNIQECFDCYSEAEWEWENEF